MHLIYKNSENIKTKSINYF